MKLSLSINSKGRVANLETHGFSEKYVFNNSRVFEITLGFLKIQGVKQKITIGTVRRQLGKRALTRQNIAGGSERGGALISHSSSGVITGPSPLDTFYGPKLCIDWFRMSST